MRGGLSGGKTLAPARFGPRRRAGREQLQPCVNCCELFDLAVMIAWSDGMWCVGCARAALELERNGTEIELRREARDLSRQTEAALQREADERCGENVVSDWSEGA